MKRRHTREQAITFCKKIKSLRPDVTFGADIIAGFPTESEIMFQDSLKLIDECKLTHLHIFPYSPREKTPASRMPQIDKKIIKERAKKLREKGKKNLMKYLTNKIGDKNFILIESSDVQKSIGKDQHFIKVQIDQKIQEGKKIYLYGASTKGNTVLQYYGLNYKKIPFAAERSPEKWGKYTVGSGVKIISENKARKLNPDYFFVMPYAFIKEFMKREKKWLKRGGKFILPYPNFKIIK